MCARVCMCDIVTQPEGSGPQHPAGRSALSGSWRSTWNEFLGALVLLSPGIHVHPAADPRHGTLRDQPGRDRLGDAPGRDHDRHDPLYRDLPAVAEVLRVRLHAGGHSSDGAGMAREGPTVTPPLQHLEAWFITGSQHLYGPEVLEKVDENARHIARCLDEAAEIPVRVVAKPVVTTPEAIDGVLRDADTSESCIGVIAWMHTFSPAKMWIGGLTDLRKPLVHLHTQYNRDLPWSDIDMDFMNLNQAAHGDREFASLQTRLRRGRKTIVGHWQDPEVARRLGWWTRAAAGWHASRRLKIARFGDNMRQVAVTEGDKVEAQARLGFSVNGYGVTELVDHV